MSTSVMKTNDAKHTGFLCRPSEKVSGFQRLSINMIKVCIVLSGTRLPVPSERYLGSIGRSKGFGVSLSELLPWFILLIVWPWAWWQWKDGGLGAPGP